MRALAVAAALGLAACATAPDPTGSRADVGYLQEIFGKGEIADLRAEAELREEVRLGIQTPFAFHGRVVDANGAPLEGAVVEMAVFDRELEPFDFPYYGWTVLPRIETGEDGAFASERQLGAGLFIEVQKDGFAPLDDPQRMYYFASSLLEENMFPLPTPAAPATFTFRSRPPGSELQRISTGAIALPEDGSTIGISLRRVKPYGVDDAEADVKASCDRAPKADDGRFDWSCTLKVPGGGVQPLAELQTFEAPMAGYEPEFMLASEALSEDWDHRSERDLFVRLRDDRYAFVTWRVRTAGEFFVTLEGTLNTTGARLVR